MNTNRNLIRICLLSVVLLALPVSVKAQFTFTTNNGAITITGYTGPGGAVTFPTNINGLLVTGIGNGQTTVFPSNNVTSVTIPGSVTSIGEEAFYDCTSLASVTIGTNVTSIGQQAFEVSGLTNIAIPSSVTNIGYLAFIACFNLTAITVDANNPAYSSVNGVVFNKNQTTLIEYPDVPTGNYTIPGTVTNIAEYGFGYCSLTSITIPNSVTNINGGAFYDCYSLTAITVNASNPVYSSVNGVLFNKNQTTLLQYPGGLSGSYTIPNGVTTVAYDVFNACYKLTGITIPNTVTSIGFYAFFYTSLTNVTIPSSVTNIGEEAFASIPSLTGVYFQGNAPTADSTVFEDDNKATAYYYAGTSGWSNPFGGIPAVMLNAPNPAGALQVTITPAGAVTAGAQWQVDGGLPQPSGATVLGLSVGSHTVSFSTISGWTTPANQNISVSANSTNTATGTYVPQSQSCFLVLDNYNSGNITITNSINSSYGNPVVGVFGGNRTILLTKAIESSETYVAVGSGVLTWNQTSVGDYCNVTDGGGSTSVDLSGYNAFSITVDSAPQNPGQLEIELDYYGSPTNIYGVSALVTLPASGSVNIPFSSFVPGSSFPPINFAAVADVGLTFRGNLLNEGAYVLDNFETVSTFVFTANPTAGTVPLSVQFTSAGVDCSGNAITHWNWGFGDGATSTVQNPSHVYTNAGTFHPSLVVTNSLGVAITGSGPSISAVFNSSLVQNGGFETGDFTGWTLSGSDTIDMFVDNGTETGIAPHSGNYLAALGPVGSLSFLSQTVSTTAGRSYLLSLWLDNPDGKIPNEFLVSWNGSTLFDRTNLPAVGWTNLQFMVTATGSSTVLQFGSRDDQSYLGLDDISLVASLTLPIIIWTNPAPIIYGTALSLNQLNATANVPGNFAFNPTNGVVLNAGTNTLSVVFIPTDSVDYASVTDTVSLVVLKSTPLVTWPAPSAITYGTALSSNQLNATANVLGSFGYNPTNGVVLTVGTNSLSVVFTPTDQADYSSLTDSVSLVVLPAVPIVTWANPAPINYGTALSSNQLDATANAPGRFGYNPTNGAVLNAGTNTLTVVFTPTDANDYQSVTDSVSLVVLKATPLVTWPAPSGITYGTALSSNQLDATVNVPGRLGYNPTNGVVLAVGTNTLSVVFTPTDQADYSSVTDSVSLVVLPAAPMVTWANPAPVTYGTALSSNQLDATANVPGRFGYNPTNGVVLNAGTSTLLAVFTPTDTHDYYSVTDTVSLVVLKTTPLVTWPVPSAITYCTALSSNQLNATANVPGTFVYSPSLGVTLNAGTNTLSVLFIPTDIADYTGATDAVSLAVSSAPLTVTANNAARANGQPNPAFTGSITGLCNGDDITAMYSCSATPASLPGTYPIVPSLQDPYGRLTNYQVTVINGTLTVTNATLPDLQVSSVSMPQQAWTDRGFDVSFVLTNSGVGIASGPWVDAVYLSSTNQFRTNQDQLLGNFYFEGQLGPGQSVLLVQTVTISRAGFTNGSYYISVVADVSNNVSEVSKANNVGISATNIYVQLLPLPELNVASVTAPTTGIAGQPVGVSWEVCNVGQADTDVPVWYDHLYLSTTTNLTGVVVDFGQYENPDYLVAGDCYPQSATVTLPIGISGPYYFIVNADSTGLLAGDAGTNRLGSTVVPVNIQLVTPGFLHVVSAQVAPTPPTVTWPGQTITCTYIVENIGQTAITGTWDDRITLSAVSNYVNGVTTVFVYENDITFAGPLAPGANYTNSAQFALPQTVAGVNVTGTWFVVPVVDIHFAAGGNGFGTGSIGRDELAAPLDVSTPPPADLQVTSVSAPTNAVAGQSINVGWTVANNGNNQTSSGYWYDGIYLSTNATFAASQSTLIGAYGHFGVLGLTSNYTQNISVTVPANLLGTNTYYLFVDADAGNAVFELNKTNNVLAAAQPLVIQQAPPTLLPDLAVTSVSAPWTSIADNQVYVLWGVTNQGPGATGVGSWLDSVYLSASAEFNLATATLLGSVAHNGTLASGASYTQGQMFTVPYCALGSNYVFVFADSAAQVNEGGAIANNVLAAAHTLYVWPDNGARLRVSAVNPPTNGLAGSPLTVSWTVLNSGGATANGPWVDALYLSPTPQLVLSNSYLLGLYTNLANLALGGSYTGTLSATVPRCFAGPYYAAVVTDAGNIVNSISCDTNDFGISSVPIQIAPNGYASLQVTGINLPVSVNSGYPWSVEWTVTNAGPSTATGTWSDAVYASLSPTLDASALLLGQFDYSSTLASGATYMQTQPVSLPPCWSGNYYIYVVADVSNRVNSAACVVNNQARSATPLTVNEGAYPDLVVNSVGIPNTAYAKQPMQVSWTVANAGSATANGPWLDSVYLSTSSTFSLNNSVLLGSYPYNGSLASGAAYSQTTSFTLPDTHGSFYAYVVTDSTNAMNECQGRANSVAPSASLLNVPVTLYPDLHVTSVQVPATAYAGQTINVSWVVTNEGTDSTPGSNVWNDAVFLSDDEVLDPSDTRLGNFTSLSSLGVGQSYTNTATVQIPPSAAGPYYVLVLADSADSLFEYLGYNDSLGWNPDAMIVSLPPIADLAATDVTVSPVVGAPGSTETIGWTVLNVSSNSIPSTWTDAVYLSTNNVWDINAVEVASQNHSLLAANSGYSASWTGPLPALTPGSYHAIVRTDVRNTVQETNLANNTAVSAKTISVDVPVMVLGQPVTNQLTTGSAQYYKVNVPAGQTVSVTLTGAATNSFNELYVRYGAVPDLGDYDFLYSTPFSPNQQINIPTTQAGWYYIMVRGGNEPGGPLGYTLEASIIQFAISGVSQNHIGDNGQVTITLTGAQFQSGATVQLVSGTNTYLATTNFFNDATSVSARFFFTNAVHGLYNVVLTNPNNLSTTATQALTIETAIPLTGQVVPGLVNNHPRTGLPFEWNGAVVNAGNVDIQYLTVAIALSQSFPIALNPPPGVVLDETNSSDNSAGACMFLARDLAPGGSLDFSFVVSGFNSQGFYDFIIPIVQSKSEYLNQIASEADALRSKIISSPNPLTIYTTNNSGVITTNTGTLPSNMAAALADTNLWRDFYAQALVANGILDVSDSNSFAISAGANLTGASANRPSPEIESQACLDCMLYVNLAKDLAYFALYACIIDEPLATPVCLELYHKAEVIIQAAELACDLTCSQPPPCTGPPSVCSSSPGDPNSMQGPPGDGASAFVGSQVPWQYTIYFENDSNALASAAQIAITNVISPSFDIRTFRVSEIAFGNITIPVPANRSFFQTRVAAPYPNPTNIVVDVTAGVDVQHNTVFWTLDAIDLNTGQLVANANEGVLPPDAPDPIGQGRVIYSIQPAAGVPTGTVITNEASIVFDNNDPINTNPTTNTVDAVPPTSSVVALPPAVLTTNFTVNWFGSDDPNGSGVADYDIYVSDNNGPWQPWQTAIATTSATYSGQPGHTYQFYSVAHDNSGNVQPTPIYPEATTFVSTNQTPILQPIADQTLIVGTSLALTNVATGSNGSQGLTFNLQNGPAGASVNPTNGDFSWTPACEQGSTTNLITIWATDNGLPPLSNSVTFAVVVGECVQVSIGSTVMQIGTTSSVPVNLLSTVALTNLSFTVNYPSNRFANWALAPSNAAIGDVTAVELDSSDASFNLGTRNGQVFQGPALAGTAVFSALSNSSAFVPITIQNIQGTKADGTLVGNTFGIGGRVVVIGSQPLLEAWMATNHRMLTVYGNPGSSYLTLFNTNLLTTNWLAGWRIPQTNLAQDYEVNEQLPQVFYRAMQFSADPPIIELNSFNGTNMTLLLYGVSGTNYVVQATTNLGAVNGWLPATNVTLTNSFQFIGTGSPTNKAMFFRAKRP